MEDSRSSRKSQTGVPQAGCRGGHRPGLLDAGRELRYRHPVMADSASTPAALRVTEIFHSIQGESSAVGRPCVFVRLTGCPLRCVWCDTAYAFSGGRTMSVAEVRSQVASLGSPLVEVTGGEPLAQRGCLALLRSLCDAGHEVLLETSGALPIREVDPRVRIIMDWKCPDSGESGRNLEENLAALKAGDEVKLVLASRADYEWARALVRSGRFGERTVLVSPVWGNVAPRALAEWVLADRLAVRFQLQLHKILFGADARGV
jgi:7-carboxy-7-deazaguanine synthase